MSFTVEIPGHEVREYETSQEISEDIDAGNLVDTSADGVNYNDTVLAWATEWEAWETRTDRPPTGRKAPAPKLTIGYQNRADIWRYRYTR